MYGALTAAFDALDRAIGRIGDLLRACGRLLTEGPLREVAFGLLLAVTALSLAVEALARGVDRALAWVERSFVTVAMLLMAALSFLDYLQREFHGFSWEIEGGPAMATLLMVWVGFLGASLATRRRSHLAVDVTDRLLSPPTARLVKRFSALVAAGLCWRLAGHAWELVAESLDYGDAQEGLVVWGALGPLLRGLAALLPGEGGHPGRTLLLLAAGLLLLAVERRLPRPARGLVLGAGSLLTTGGLVGVLDLLWDPTNPYGDPLQVQPIEDGGPFPLWLGQLVLPLAFGLMALRFAAMGLSGRVTPPPGPAEPLPPDTRPGDRRRADILVAGLLPGLLLGMAATLQLGTGTLILLAGIALVLVGAPLFVAIGMAALACVTLISDLSGYQVAKDMFEATKKEELLAIPFFVLAGALMTSGSIADRLIAVARAAMGRLPGGLGLATIFACVIFAAISGSSPVTVIAIGTILFPMLRRAGYPEDYSLGVLTSAGSLGIIIPPSIPMILYAIMVGTPRDPLSPTDLFLAGVLPGLFIASVLALYTLYRTRPSATEGRLLAESPGEGAYLPTLVAAIRRGALALLLPVLVLGGIYGILGPLRFTVTEAAAAAVVYALVVELLVHRELKLRDLSRVLVDSSVMMGSLFVIIVLAIAFNRFLAHQEVPQHAAEWLASHVGSRLQFLLLVNLFLLALGCVMEIVSAILIVAPLLAPMAARFGIDPVHFGIIFIVNLELGYLTPPMGINLFVASTVFDRPLLRVVRGTIPFLLLMLFCLAVIAFVPWLSLALLD